MFDTSTIPHWPEDVQLAWGEIRADFQQDILTDYEAEILNGLHHDGRRKEYLSGRHLFRFLLKELGLDTTNAGTLRDEKGKPSAMVDGEHYFLSFAHSGDQLLCAISKSRDIGVDIEHLDRKIDDALIQRVAHPDEVGNLSALQIWTIKEAALKQRGIGIRMNLKELHIQMDENRGVVDFGDDTNCDFCTFTENHHRISLAYT